MSAALKCDICGKFYEKDECSHVLVLNKRMFSGNHTNIFTGDVCDHCVERISIALTSMGCIDMYINKRANEGQLQEGV